MGKRIESILVTVVIVAALVGGSLSAQAQSPSDYQKILQEKSPAFVTIKFVMKIKAGDKQSESQAESSGVMIDSKGLVLCSNTRMGGIGAYYRSMGRDVTTTPTELKVLVGDDTEGLDAKVIARDTELDLAWVQIKDADSKKFACIDLSDSAESEVGAPVIAIRRMSKLFDRLAVVSESRIGGVTKKPRKLYVPALSLANEFGLTVFTPDGKVLGVPILHGLSDEDQDSADRFSRAADMQELAAGLILPASDVVEATKRARLAASTQPEADQTQPASSQPAAQTDNKNTTPPNPQDKD